MMIQSENKIPSSPTETPQSPKDWRTPGSTYKKNIDAREIKRGYLSLSVMDLRYLVFALFFILAMVSYREYNALEAIFVDIQSSVLPADLVLQDLNHHLVWLAFGVMAMTLLGLYYYVKGVQVYLMDFAICQPPEHLKISHERFMEYTIRSGKFSEDNVEFQRKILSRSGVGHDTYFPPGIHKNPPELSMKAAREEFDFVMTNCLDDLFKRTGVDPQDIDILIVNCSLFNTTPSMAARIMNHYKMKNTIKSYNLSGMGCSAGLVSVDLAKTLLEAMPNSRCIVLSTENITQNWYLGNDRSMLVSNCIFRMGGAALLLSNRSMDKYRSKFQLLHTVRVTNAAKEDAYNAVYQLEDDAGCIGVRLSKDLIAVVGEALRTNLTLLGPLVLPLSEQFKFFKNVVYRRYISRWMAKPKQNGQKPAAYTPDFTKAFQHICIHAGGRAVIDGLEQNLALTPRHVLPSRATLYRYGNTSSSSIWYELAFMEQSRGGIKRGERVWQLAFGSGFKCNSAVWQALRSIKQEDRGDWSLEGFSLDQSEY